MTFLSEWLFLFVNQTQCGPYYESAKAYFSRNQIWDEMCFTLVCQAGTDIVIQKYTEAQVCCQQALEISSRYGISLHQPEKLYMRIGLTQLGLISCKKNKFPSHFRATNSFEILQN